MLAYRILLRFSKKMSIAFVKGITRHQIAGGCLEWAPPLPYKLSPKPATG